MKPATRFSPDSWEARDLRSMLHCFSHLGTLQNQGPVVIERGEGIYIEDTHGRRYLEANSGLWNAIMGFNHPELIAAASEQLHKFPTYHAFFGRAADSSVALAEKLIEIAPVPMSKVLFTNSGSEANDTVVKMLWMINRSREMPQRRKIMSRRDSYHGVTAVTSSMTGRDYVNAFGLPLEGFIWTDSPHYWRYGSEGESEAEFTARCAENLEQQILEEGPETIAGFFAEPVMGAAGVVPPSEGYFEAIQPILKKYAIPLVADEVVCGFGRTGKLWGSQTYNIKPDIIVASKCITAGYFPMGAILVSEKINKQLIESCADYEEFPHGFTTGGHPLGCAIALKAIDLILNGGVFDNLVAVAPHFSERLHAFEGHPAIGEIRCVGLMGALELVSDKETKAPFPPKLQVSEKIANTALTNGLICRPVGPSILLAPPFIITETQLDELFDKLQLTMDQVLP